MGKRSDSDQELPPLPRLKPKSRSTSSPSKKKPPKRKAETQDRSLVLWIGIAAAVIVPLLGLGGWMLWSSGGTSIEAPAQAPAGVAAKPPDENLRDAVFVRVEGSQVIAETEMLGVMKPVTLPVPLRDLHRWEKLAAGQKFHLKTHQGPATKYTRKINGVISEDVVPGAVSLSVADAESILPPADPQVLAEFERTLPVAEAIQKAADDAAPPPNVDTPLLLALCWPERAEWIAAAKIPAGADVVYKNSDFETRVKVFRWLRARPEVKLGDYLPGLLRSLELETRRGLLPEKRLTVLCELFQNLTTDDLIALLFSEDADDIPVTVLPVMNRQAQLDLISGEDSWLTKLLTDPRAEAFSKTHAVQYNALFMAGGSRWSTPAEIFVFEPATFKFSSEQQRIQWVRAMRHFPDPWPMDWMQAIDMCLWSPPDNDQQRALVKAVLQTLIAGADRCPKLPRHLLWRLPDPGEHGELAFQALAAFVPVLAKLPEEQKREAHVDLSQNRPKDMTPAAAQIYDQAIAAAAER